MFKKVLIAEDMDFINSGIKSQLSELGIPQIDYVQYCDEALLKLKCANFAKTCSEFRLMCYTIFTAI